MILLAFILAGVNGFLYLNKDRTARKFSERLTADLVHGHPVYGIRNHKLFLRFSVIVCDLYAVPLLSERKACRSSLFTAHFNMHNVMGNGSKQLGKIDLRRLKKGRFLRHTITSQNKKCLPQKACCIKYAR